NNDEQNAYEIVGVGSDATDADIKKGFRQRSLKTHPDRNPHLKDAARLFHELTQAQNKRTRKRNQRRRQNGRNTHRRPEQIRDAGRRMVEERQAELLRQQKEAELAERSAQEELDPPPLGAYPLSFSSLHAQTSPQASTTPPSVSGTRSPSTPT
ncbi:hypothetical protein EDB92DRAFT_1841400, partial [Lactarius akahatsu]